MKRTLRAMGLAMTTIGIFGSSPVLAAPEPPPTDIPGWKDLSDAVRDLPTKLLSALPEARRNDPQVKQEVAQLAMESLAVALLDALGGDGDHPMFVPNQNLALDFPMPNADTVYRTARIAPGGSYRLRGERGTLALASLVQIGGRPVASAKPATPTAPSARPTLDINSLKIDRTGHFDLLLSPTRPANYTGDWWQLADNSGSLLLRLVAADWTREKDPTISIERIDIPARATRPSADQLESRLRTIPAAIAMLPTMFVGHFEKLRASGAVNSVASYDLSKSGGLAGQSYYEGAFELSEGEALLMEVKAPAHCPYWSVILGDDLHRTLDWVNNHSSLNNAQGKVDSDGMLRFVISDSDPGVPNWLDTAGHHQGVIQGRWLGCDSNPVPQVRKVAMTEIRALFPRDTPTISVAQREAQVRERRAAAQHRALW